MAKILDLDTMVGVFPRKKADISLNRLKELMAGNSVDSACVLSARGVFYDSDDGNGETLSLIDKAEEPGFLYPAGTVDIRSWHGNTDRLQSLRDRGVRLWRLFPDFQGWDLSHPGFHAFLDFLDGSEDLLYMPGLVSRIKNAVGNRRIRVIIDSHFYDFADTWHSLEDSDGFYLATRRLHGPGIIGKVRDRFGAEKMCFASGSPLMSLRGALDVVRAADLAEYETEAILGGNLARLMGVSDK